jgi:signal peptidase II
MPPSVRGWISFAAVAGAAAVADLATKQAVFARLGLPGTSPPIALIPNWLRLETSLNEGALFGMGQGMGWLFAAFSLLAMLGILGMVARGGALADRWLLVALALIFGGIVGNLFDRLGLPGLIWHAPLERVGEPVRAVRDWIHFLIPGLLDWPIFNLADTWLVIGAGMLLVAALRPVPPADAGASGPPPEVR